MAATVEDLVNALQDTSSIFNRWDQIIPGLFLGNAEIAKDVSQLKTEHITHVLNVAFIPPGDPGHAFSVGGDEEFYRTNGLRVTFRGLNIVDDPSFQICKYFDVATEFIDKALQAGGRVLVHCYVGVSRAATIVIAYLMIKRGYSALESVKIVGRKRHIFPNSGFLKQIRDLDSQLLAERKQWRRNNEATIAAKKH